MILPVSLRLLEEVAVAKDSIMSSARRSVNVTLGGGGRSKLSRSYTEEIKFVIHTLSSIKSFVYTKVFLWCY